MVESLVTRKFSMLSVADTHRSMAGLGWCVAVSWPPEKVELPELSAGVSTRSHRTTPDGVTTHRLLVESMIKNVYLVLKNCA